MLLAGSLFALLRSFIFNTAGERVVARLRILLFKSIISQEIGYVGHDKLFHWVLKIRCAMHKRSVDTMSTRAWSLLIFLSPLFFVYYRLFDKRKTGELLSRLGTDTTSLQDVATSSVSMFFRGVIQLLFNLIIMIVSSWKLTLVVFAVVPTIIVAIVSTPTHGLIELREKLISPESTCMNSDEYSVHECG